MVYRHSTRGLGLPESDRETFNVRESGSPEPSGQKTPTHLDAVVEYQQSHGALAAEGVTLLSHVTNFLINNTNAPEMSPAALEAVERESLRLKEQWDSGEVKSPW